jgi:hypothetical protein
MSFCFLSLVAIFPPIETQKFSEFFGSVIRAAASHFSKASSRKLVGLEDDESLKTGRARV